MKKHTYVRNGQVREFTQQTIDLYSTETSKFPESAGWIRQPEEIGGHKPKVIIPAGVKTVVPEPAKTEPTKTESSLPPVGKIAQDYTTNAENIAEIKKLLSGRTAEEVNEFFEGDGRTTMIKLKDEILSTLS